MGGGGTTGEVRFPPYIEDLHGRLMADEETNRTDGYFLTSNWIKPDKNVMAMMNSIWTGNVYTGLVFTSPTTDFAASKSQFDLYYSAVTGYGRSNYASYIADAILAIGNSTTVPIADLTASLSTSALSSPQTLFGNFGTKMRTEIASYISTAFTEIEPDVVAFMKSASSSALAHTTLTAATTLWDSLVDTVDTKLKTCGIPKDANLLSILTKAHQDSVTNVKDAVKLAEKIIDDGLLTDIVTQFSGRRSIEFARQHSDFAGQMADVNAINSTGFLFGTALLKSEQMREVSEFDSQLSMESFRQTLNLYFQTHSTELQVGAQVEIANATAHNRLLEASIQLLTVLSRREEIVPNDLLALYSDFFRGEMQIFDDITRTGLDAMRRLFDRTSSDQLGRDLTLSELTLNADRINKIVREQRYAIGLGQVVGLINNEVEFERMSTEVLTDQNRIKITGLAEHEDTISEVAIKEKYYELEVARIGADIMVAPGGMSAPIPGGRSKAQSVLGGAFKGASVGATVGSVVPGVGNVVGGAIGAGVGGLLGAVG